MERHKGAESGEEKEWEGTSAVYALQFVCKRFPKPFCIGAKDWRATRQCSTSNPPPWTTGGTLPRFRAAIDDNPWFSERRNGSEDL